MKKINLILLLCMSWVIIMISCEKKNEQELFPPKNECETNDVTYSTTIKTILNQKCLSCHTGTSLTGLDYTTYEGILVVVNNGKLLEAINHTGNAKPMPQGAAKLDKCTIEKITKWVNDGAPEN